MSAGSEPGGGQGEGERIGVLGGTFDPPHVAHVALGEAAWNGLRLDRVIFVPAGDPWRKAGRRVSPGEQRLELVRAAVDDLAWAEVSTLEIDRPGPSYSQETLAALRMERPGAQLWFILGADALTDMPHWHQPERIIELARLAVATRPGAPRDGDGEPLIPEELRERFPGIEHRVDVVPMQDLEVSATDLRERLREGRSTEQMLAPAVRALIDARGWYRDE